jgi:hypothetical protein
MSSTDAMAEAREQGLGILADTLLKLVLHMQQHVFESEDSEQKVRGIRAVHQLGRGYRQTVALQAKLARDARRDAAQTAEPQAPAEPAQAPPDPRTLAVTRRRDWLRRGVERCVWNEYDREDETEEFTGESLLEDFHERLADLMEDPEAFLALDPCDLIVQLCKDLGLKPPEFQPPAPAVPAAASAGGHDPPTDSS